MNTMNSQCEATKYNQSNELCQIVSMLKPEFVRILNKQYLVPAIITAQNLSRTCKSLMKLEIIGNVWNDLVIQLNHPMCKIRKPQFKMCKTRPRLGASKYVVQCHKCYRIKQQNSSYYRPLNSLCGNCGRVDIYKETFLSARCVVYKTRPKRSLYQINK